jgi:hypothetical protein
VRPNGSKGILVISSARLFLIVALTALLPAYGCQVISASITSPSDSVSGTGRAIGGSSEAISVSSGSDPDDDSKPSYERDLREYTASFVRSGGKTADFKPGVSRIAASHGISNWEADSKSPEAIGAGLAAASLSETQARTFCSDQAFSVDFTNKVMSAWKSAK